MTYVPPEITLEKLDPQSFIDNSITVIQNTVGDGIAINALSGGVDSSVVTMIGHRALGDHLRTVFIDNGLMRQGEPEQVVLLFRNNGVPVELINAQDEFFAALRGIVDPEKKRQAITDTFYRDVFGRLIRESGARFLLHGTNLTDVEETVAGIKRQHNILAQLGIDTEEAYGYAVIEPLVRLRKPAVREVARALGLPGEISDRPPFPGPALAIRVMGAVTPKRIGIVRVATAIVERHLKDSNAFQYLAILHSDKFTGIRDGKRAFGYQIEIRCWESSDAVKAWPTRLYVEDLRYLADEIQRWLPDVTSVTYNIASKPPSTIEPG